MAEMQDINTSPSSGYHQLVIGLSLSVAALLASTVSSVAAEPLWTPIPSTERTAAVIAEIEKITAPLSAEIRQEKLEKMNRSAFSFLRANAILFFRDLDRSVISRSQFSLSHAPTQVQGDAHAFNVGAFEDGSGTIIFDLNDFDQAWAGSYLLDVWRMAVSLRLLADDAKLDEAADIDRTVAAFADSYLQQVLAFATKQNPASFKLDKETALGPARRLIQEAEEEEGRKVMLSEWTQGNKKNRRFRRLKDLGEIDDAIAASLTAAVDIYADGRAKSEGDSFEEGYFKVLDVARRLRAGLGSLGVDRFYVLIEGPSKSPKDDVILDIKAHASRPSVARPDAESWLQDESPGCRVAAAERAMLAAADPVLGCLSFNQQSFSVRQRNPFKKSLKARKIKSADDLVSLARELGKALAAGHARGAQKAPLKHRDSFLEAAAATFESAGPRAQFRHEVSELSAAYSLQVEIDFGIFQRTVSP